MTGYCCGPWLSGGQFGGGWLNVGRLEVVGLEVANSGVVSWWLGVDCDVA